MLYQILSFLLDVLTGLVGGACLMRLYMQQQRIPFGNPLGRAVLALSNWLVLPLRRVLPGSLGGWDLSSALAAYVLQTAQVTLLWLMLGARGAVVALPVLAAFGVLRLVITGLSALLILYAVLSWVRADTPMADLIERLCMPVLAPVRRVLPLVGGLDLSPLAVLVLLQVAAIVLGGLQAAALTTVG